MLSTVTAKGQVTLPKAVRNDLGIEPGTRLSFQVQPDGTIKVQVLKRGSAGLFGLIARTGEAPRSLEQIESGIAAAVTARSRKAR